MSRLSYSLRAGCRGFDPRPSVGVGGVHCFSVKPSIPHLLLIATIAYGYVAEFWPDGLGGYLYIHLNGSVGTGSFVHTGHNVKAQEVPYNLCCRLFPHRSWRKQQS